MHYNVFVLRSFENNSLVYRESLAAMMYSKLVASQYQSAHNAITVPKYTKINIITLVNIFTTKGHFKKDDEQ